MSEEMSADKVVVTDEQAKQYKDQKSYHLKTSMSVASRPFKIWGQSSGTSMGSFRRLVRIVNTTFEHREGAYPELTLHSEAN